MRAKKINEAIKHMLGISQEELAANVEKELLKSEQHTTSLELALIAKGKNLIYHVWSGLDAFEYKDRNGNKAYPQYIAVIAKNQRDARQKVAAILGQKLEYQHTPNMGEDYDNFIYNAEFIKEYKG